MSKDEPIASATWDTILNQIEPATVSEIAAKIDELDGELIDVPSDATPTSVVGDAIEDGILVETNEELAFPTYHVQDDPGDTSGADEDDTEVDADTDAAQNTPAGLPSYEQLFDEARERAGTEWWELIPDDVLSAVFSEYDSALSTLLDPDHTDEDKPPALAFNDKWVAADVSGADESTDVRWYCRAGDEPRPDEFRRFHELLTTDTPDDYTPHYFRVEPAAKGPALRFGGWKNEDARLTAEEAVEWMEQGGNVGIAGRPDGPLVNLDIDDDEQTTPDDHPTTLLADSRSRSGYHGWFFNTEGDIPNIPTDTDGEIRTDWQYVVAPGSFVASAGEEIPDGADDPGYYTVGEESPVASIEYDDLPPVFREFHEEQAEVQEHDHDNDIHLTDGGGSNSAGSGGEGYDSDSAVFDVSAEEVLRKAGGSTSASGRFSSVFHGSSTSANMALSDQGKLHCWRHNVAHGGLQALATLSKHSPNGDTACRQIGKAHKHGGSGRNRYKGDWQLVWWAWSYAKRRSHVPSDDPIPHSALTGLALKHDLCDRDDLEDGWKLPTEVYNDALELVESTYDRDPGREPFTAGSGGDTKPTVVIPDPPNAPVELADQHVHSDGWNWRAASEQDRQERERKQNDGDGLTLNTARERTQSAIASAYESADRVLIEALMTLGKSYGSIAAAADTDEPITYLTNRGNSEQYAEAAERCEEFDLSYTILPSAFRECPTFRGDHGSSIKESARKVYANGATAKNIHVNAADQFGQQLPCEQGEGQCPWKQAWGTIDPDSADVLIGHYSHAHVMSATKSRTVVFDEFPGGAFETQFGGKIKHRDTELSGPVSHFLDNTPALDIDDYADLMAARDDDQRHADALNWFLGHIGDKQPGHDPGLAFSSDGHALAPIAAFVLLAGGSADSDLGNGWETVDFSGLGGPDDFDGWRSAYDRENNALHILAPPSEELQYASGVVALDGTPTKKMWELALGSRLNHRQVLADNERIDYLADVLDHNYVITTEYTKPYSSGRHVYAAEDGALLEWIAETYGVKPGLITTAAAQCEYHHADPDEIDFKLDTEYDETLDADIEQLDQTIADESSVCSSKHHGDILGSNEFDHTRVGVLTGSRHYGDNYVKKWAAFAGRATERTDSAETGKGGNLEFTGFGNDVYKHMTEHQTLQAAMRFGRDGLGAVTYVHTDTLPNWVEQSRVVDRRPGVVRTYSDGERDVLDAIQSDAIGAQWRVRDVADHPGVSIGTRQVRSHLMRLAKRGVLDRRYEGNGYVYRDDGLHRVTDRGEVELDAIDIDALDEMVDEEGSEAAGNIITTWAFRPQSDTTTPTGGTVGASQRADESLRSDGGNPPPTPGS